MLDLETNPDLAHLEKISIAQANKNAFLSEYSQIKNLLAKLGGEEGYNKFIKN